MIQLSKGCIQGSPQVFLTGNQGSVKQLGLPTGSEVAETGKDKPSQKSLEEAEDQKQRTPSTVVISEDTRSIESRVRIPLDQIESRRGVRGILWLLK